VASLPVIVSTACLAPLGLSAEAGVERLRASGAAGALLGAPLGRARADELASRLLRSGLPVEALEVACLEEGAALAQLVSVDREEARAALASATSALRWGAERGIRRAVVRLGTLRELEPDWPALRDRYLKGGLDPRYARRAALYRDTASGRPLDAARRALEPLCTVADGLGLELLVLNPRRLIESPSPRELRHLLTELRGAPLRPAFDASAAHLADDMGLWPLVETTAVFGSQAGLALLGDAAGAVGGLPPGAGVVPLALLAEQLPLDCLRAFSAHSLLSEPELHRAVRAVSELPGGRPLPPLLGPADSEAR
jgi:hypothetical protein